MNTAQDLDRPYTDGYMKSIMIKKYYGRSFHSIMAEIKMNKASDLLKNPALPITDIASEIG